MKGSAPAAAAAMASPPHWLPPEKTYKGSACVRQKSKIYIGPEYWRPPTPRVRPNTVLRIVLSMLSKYESLNNIRDG